MGLAGSCAPPEGAAWDTGFQPLPSLRFEWMIRHRLSYVIVRVFTSGSMFKYAFGGFAFAVQGCDHVTMYQCDSKPIKRLHKMRACRIIRIPVPYLPSKTVQCKTMHDIYFETENCSMQQMSDVYFEICLNKKQTTFKIKTDSIRVDLTVCSYSGLWLKPSCGFTQIHLEIFWSDMRPHTTSHPRIENIGK